MRTPLALSAVLALVTSGCVSAFPPSSLDYGRGPQPLERGTLRIQAGGGGGVAPLFVAGGGAVGARGELQVSEHIAVALDGGAGLQLQPLLLTAPFGTHVSTQLNPGVDWLALRAAVGVGGDTTAFTPTPLPAVLPWVSAAGSVVLGLPPDLSIDGLDPYLSLNLGLRRYASSAEGLAIPTSPVRLLYERVYASGATLGAAWRVTDVLSLYGAANTTVVVVEERSAQPGSPAFGFSPVFTLQGGVAFEL